MRPRPVPASSLSRDTRGASLTEYLIVVGMIGLLVLAGFRAFGGAASSKSSRQADCVAALDPNCGRSDLEPGAKRVIRTASAAAAVQATPSIASRVAKVLQAVSPMSTAQAAEPGPRMPARDADVEGNRIADQIKKTLQRQFPHGEIGNPTSPLWPRRAVQQQNMWGDTWGNELPGALLQSPPASHWGKPSSTLGNNHSDFLIDELRDTIASAKQSVVLSTLAAPSDRYVAAMREALIKLDAEQRAAGGSGVDVRILIGAAPPGRDEHGNLRPADTSVRAFLDDVTRGLPAASKVRVTVGTYGGDPGENPMLSWNHSKIVAVDGRVAIVGGHNWWEGDYNGENPVHDVSIKVQGPAAQQAQAYFDELWKHTLAAGAHSTREGEVTPGPVAKAPEAKPGEGTRILSVGAPGGAFFNVTAYAPADTAILTMIRAANSTVKISQQELVSLPNLDSAARKAIDQKLDGNAVSRLAPGLGEWLKGRVQAATDDRLKQHISPALLDELGLALLRGVKVEIAVTNMDLDAGTDGYSHGWSTEQTRAAVAQHVRDDYDRLVKLLPKTTPVIGRAALDGRLADNLDVRAVRFSDETAIPVKVWDSGEEKVRMQPVRNHAKVIIVDDAAAYVGSQNLYPGGMADRTITQLSEFGFIVVGHQVQGPIVADYWNRMWPLAKPSGVRPP